MEPQQQPLDISGALQWNPATISAFDEKILKLDIGLFYDSGFGLKLGASYKTTQKFKEFEFKNTYLDNTISKNSFHMNYQAILSLGLGFSLGDIDLALDFRRVDYENTDYNPMLIPSNPPYGAVPTSEVAYDMTTSMVMIGINYTFKSK